MPALVLIVLVLAALLPAAADAAVTVSYSAAEGLRIQGDADENNIPMTPTFY